MIASVMALLKWCRCCRTDWTEKFPVLPAVVAEQTLAEQRPAKRHDVRENQGRPRPATQLRKESGSALEIFARVVDGLQNAMVTVEEYLGIHAWNEIQIRERVIAQA